MKRKKMSLKKMKRFFGYESDTEYIRRTMNIPTDLKLKWLKETNEFINKKLSKEEKRVWDRFIQGQFKPINAS